MQVLSVKFEPTTVVVGQPLTLTVTLKNNSTGVADTQIPAPGTIYQDSDSYKSFGYDEVQGRIRFAMEYAGRDASKYPDHPFRWGLGHALAAGETQTVSGQVILNKIGTWSVWMGLVKEQVAWLVDNQAPTTITVVSQQPQPSVTFTATPEQIQEGETSTLAWDCQNVKEDYLDGVGVARQGSKVVTPVVTTTYTLRVIFPDDTEHLYLKTVTVKTVTVTITSPTDLEKRVAKLEADLAALLAKLRSV
jgi:hypothetical protein